MRVICTRVHASAALVKRLANFCLRRHEKCLPYAEMRTAPIKSRSFRPSQRNAERLEFAEKYGINVSKLIDDALVDVLPAKLAEAVKQRQQELKKLMTAPLPS